MFILKATVRSLIGVGALAALSACATVTEEDRAQTVDVSTLSGAGNAPIPTVISEASSHLVLYRKWNGEGLAFMGSGPKVTLDGKEIGRCKLGDGLKLELSPGEHIITSWSQSENSRRFVIDPGETVYVQCRYTPGVFAPNVELLIVSGQVGREDTDGN